MRTAPVYGEGRDYAVIIAVAQRLAFEQASAALRCTNAHEDLL